MDSLAEALARAQREDDPYVEGIRVVDETLPADLDLSFYEFHSVEFDHCVLIGANLRKASFYDCEFNGCDLSNARLDEAFFVRTRLASCKLEGAQLHKAVLRSTRLVGCMCRYANLGEATFEGSLLSECDFREAFMNEVRLRKKTRLHECDLERADFFRTSLAGIDLSTCNIAGLMVSDTRSELRGACIGADQAIDLVGMLGVRVVD